MIFNVILKDLVEIFLDEFVLFSVYPLGTGSVWTFLDPGSGSA